MPEPIFFLQNYAIPNTLTPPPINNDSILPPKLIKASLFISSLNISQQMKDNLIKNALKSTDYDIINDSKLLSTLNYVNPQPIIYSNNIIMQTKPNISNCNKNTRILFTKEEDDRIKQLVAHFGTGHWNLVANYMERRTAKQCRDRYLNYLIPGCFQGEWSKSEDDLLIKLYKEIGPRWSVIQKYFPNRGPNSIKNRWNYFISKQYQIPCKNVKSNTDQITSENTKD